MNQTQLSTLASYISANHKGDSTITGVKVDARLIEPGDLFVCLKGARVDGHDFAKAALDRGATGLMVDRYLDIDIPQILVNDTYDGIIELAKVYRSKLSALFIGITGSNGKTSTKDMFNSILSLVGKTHATFSNQNTDIGTCLNLFKMDMDTQYGVFELGLDYVGDIEAMADIIKPDYALVMSVAPTHIVNFDNELHIAKEKFDIFKHTSKEHCFYQGDFDLLRSLDKGYTTFGFNDNNDYVVRDVTIHNEGISFSVNDINYTCNLLGTHQGSNAAGVIAVLKSLGIEKTVIQEGLNTVALTELRTEILQHDKALILLDAYKSNPDSAAYAIEILEHYEYEGEKAVILSEMVELGDLSNTLHHDLLERLAQSDIKYITLMGKEFKDPMKTIDFKDKKVVYVEDYEHLIPVAKAMFSEPIMILIKGSRRYALERLLKEG